ncbi:hypothetical protein PN36_17805 [Candidatus Thiomargarita nelsonii]|uniref:Cytochrome C n=1 Tax=Candidatus Thiomargarita nelsonii TaxID=1003181 RepID=A0A0A6P214_9GAMM|nr:hypothetical protein PN36_17805 [Candidatus Thiomargarita nelsonii]
MQSISQLKLRLFQRKCFFLSFFMIASLASCTSSANKDHNALSENTEKASKHALSNQPLKKIMNELNDLLFEQIPTELELDRLRSRYALRIAENTTQSLSTIEEMLQLEKKFGLSQAESQRFRELTKQLQTQAQALERVAMAGQTEAISPALGRMIGICNTCHQEFHQIYSE